MRSPPSVPLRRSRRAAPRTKPNATARAARKRRTKESAMGIRTGRQFLDSLRDDRQIWLAGERVSDVLSHPRLGPAARTLAELYDLQHRADLSEQLTYPSPATGDRIGLTFID